MTAILAAITPTFCYLAFAQSSSQLQAAADRTMAGHAGSLVVADVVSGRVLAAVNLDVAANVVESPGSALKPFVLMALLESGRLDPNDRQLCRRALRIDGVQMDCTHPASIKLLNSEDAIAYSCNSFVAATAPRLSSDELVRTLRRAGLDSTTGLANSETTGHIDRPTSRGGLQLEALGTRGVEVTPLELLEAYRKLARRKRSGDLGRDGPVFAGLQGSVDYGMAHAAYLDGMKIAGKTGTAASGKTARTHGFFVGYAPADQPEIVMVVFLEQGRGLDAAALAPPVFAVFARDRKTK